MITAALLGVLLAAFAAAFLAPAGLSRPATLLLCALALLLSVPLEPPEESLYRGAWAALYAVISGLLLSEALAAHQALKAVPRASTSGDYSGYDKDGEETPDSREEDSEPGYSSTGMRTKVGYRERLSPAGMVVDFVLGMFMFGLAMGVVF